MADATNIAADEGKPIAATDNTLAVPGPPEVEINGIAHEGGKVESDDDMKDHKASQQRFVSPQAEQKSPLLTLAPEIRNMIFKLCLCHPEDIGGKLSITGASEGFSMMRYYTKGSARPKVRETYEMSISGRTKGAIKHYSFRNLKLMRTCQAVYMEAARVLWGQQFAFHSLVHLQSFLLTDGRFDLVRNIKIWSVDNCIGVNWIPIVCAVLADKVRNLECLDVDMLFIHRNRAGKGAKLREGPFRNDEEVRQSGVNLGFDIYSCMHPWVTQVVRDKGIDELMDILRIHTEIDRGDKSEAVRKHNARVHHEFRGAGPLTPTQRAIVKKAVAEEIVRLVDVYEKKP